jgi:hypothetical protein
MKESSVRKRVTKALKKLHAIAVENDCYPGTPDVNYVHGWIELKVRDAWPVRAETPVTLPHFTEQQRIWLRQRQEVGGRCYLLLVVDKEWLLFSGAAAATFVGRVCRSELYDWAEVIWQKSPTDESLLKAFS